MEEDFSNKMLLTYSDSGGVIVGKFCEGTWELIRQLKCKNMEK